ncbi:hypothetical protein LLEC1_07579 [Akanthomyces lecanii]|uniref:F-box domain-containing protein n=1 Tax=Cordyceps confragosa TaxID=2714763 RepID=A0A179I9K2_CORDF|nr:hypothetical protein LLEC1_07579 [Akanthomyces lecanii]
MSPSLATGLAPEIILLVSQNLPGSDIKNLRLTCRFLGSLIRPGLHRVFISSNQRDIAVFRAVAEHETFRAAVTEIVWDDARLSMMEFDEHHLSPCDDSDCLCEEQCANNDNEAPPAYVEACHDNADRLWKRLRGEAHLEHNVGKARKLACQVPFSTSWQCYRGLMQKQKQVIDANLDIEALEYGLRRFPSLKRITITPATHGYLFSPLYETPMIRSFPYGLNYLIPRGWPTALDRYNQTTPRWDVAVARDYYRGFTNTMRLLAEGNHCHVKELVIDTCQQPTGISCEMFGAPNASYDHFCRMLQFPGFRRLDLALHISTAWYSSYASLRGHQLRDALASATDLESMHLYTNAEPNPDAVSLEDGEASMAHFIPLQSILPIAAWQKLRHFGLSRFTVCQSDVIELLKNLPASIRTVELSFLYFLEGRGNYGTLLKKMRAELGWQQRPDLVRPRVSISVHVHRLSDWELSACADRAVQDYLYHAGANPFATSGWDVGELRPMAGVERNILEPGHSRPYVEQERQ